MPNTHSNTVQRPTRIERRKAGVGKFRRLSHADQLLFLNMMRYMQQDNQTCKNRYVLKVASQTYRSNRITPLLDKMSTLGCAQHGIPYKLVHLSQCGKASLIQASSTRQEAQ